MTPTPDLIVGIDIAAETFTASWLQPGLTPTKPRTFPQTAAGFQALQAVLVHLDIAPAHTLVVMEATGPYWQDLALNLHLAGCVISVINPLQAHHFAKAQLRRAKTDDRDAQDLAQLGATLPLPRWTPPPAIMAEVRQHLMTREQLLVTRQTLSNQRAALLKEPIVVESLVAHFDALIADMGVRLEHVTRDLKRVLEQSAWQTSFACLMSIPGLGLITAAWILVATVNCTMGGSAAAATAYAGLAPMPYQSGTSVRRRPTIGHMGNRHLRKALYMATLSAARHNPAVKAIYTRLRAAGKPHKVARCAAARKLLHIAWAVVTKRQMYDPQRAVPITVAPIQEAA